MIFINTDNSLVFIEKKEGLHPNDNDYSKIISLEPHLKSKKFELINVKNNIAIYKCGIDEIRVLPSVFNENVNNEGLTELLIDFTNEDVQVFSLVYN